MLAALTIPRGPRRRPIVAVRAPLEVHMLGSQGCLESRWAGAIRHCYLTPTQCSMSSVSRVLSNRISFAIKNQEDKLERKHEDPRIHNWILCLLSSVLYLGPSPHQSWASKWSAFRKEPSASFLWTLVAGISKSFKLLGSQFLIHQMGIVVIKTVR